MSCIMLHQEKIVCDFGKTKVSILSNCSENMIIYWSYKIFIPSSDYSFSLIQTPLVRKEKKKNKTEKIKKNQTNLNVSVSYQFCANFSLLLAICIASQGPAQTVSTLHATHLGQKCPWHLPCQIKKSNTTALGYISFWKVYLPETRMEGLRRAPEILLAHRKYLNSHRTVAP